jgi:hypothetical protein
MSEVLIGSIGVDSGQMMLCDPCYIESSWENETIDFKNIDQYAGKFNYGGACQATLSDKGAGILEDGIGAVCATGFGDGSYNVYVTYSDEGSWGKRISEMRIVFIGDEVEEDDEEECFYCCSVYCDGECQHEENDDE